MMPSGRVAVVLGLLAALVFGVAPVNRLRAARESRPDFADGPAKGRQSFDAKPLNAAANAARAFAYTPRGGTVLPSRAPQLRSMGSTAITAASDTTPTAPVDPLDTAPANAIIRSAWTPAASLADARMKHTATVLGDGRVLVAGGFAYTPFGPLAWWRFTTLWAPHGRQRRRWQCPAPSTPPRFYSMEECSSPAGST